MTSFGPLIFMPLNHPSHTTNTGHPVGGSFQKIVKKFEFSYFFPNKFRTPIFLAKIFSDPHIHYINLNTSNTFFQTPIFLSKIISDPHNCPSDQVPTRKSAILFCSVTW